MRVFRLVAEKLSFSRSAEELNMSQGAVSYQIKRLEDELGFLVFDRRSRNVQLTFEGAKLYRIVEKVLDEFDAGVTTIRREVRREIIIGVTNYFGARWLSRRLSRFISKHPEIRIYLSPYTGGESPYEIDADAVIYWRRSGEAEGGSGRILAVSAFPVCGPEVARRISGLSFSEIVRKIPVIHDHETTDAWVEYCQLQGVSFDQIKKSLVIPDASLRFQAVIDNQGFAMMDDLVVDEIRLGTLVRPFSLELRDYEYCIHIKPASRENRDLTAFTRWLFSELPA